MIRSPIGAAIALFLAAGSFGCADLLQAPEDRERIQRIKDRITRHPSQVDVAAEHGQPALHLAVIDGEASLLEWLLDRGADPNRLNDQARTALHIAAIYDGTRDRWFIATLIRRGGDVNAPADDGSTPLHVAAGFGQVKTVEALLAGGARPGVRTHSGDTPLHFAASSQPNRSAADCRRIINLLVAHGADPDDRPAHEMTPLHRAALGGHAHVVRALLEAGAKIDVSGPRGSTALHIAASGGHPAVVLELLAHGADVNRLDRDRHTPLAVALERAAFQYPEGLSRPSNVEQTMAILRKHGGR